MNRKNENNKVEIVGIFISNFQYSHSVLREKFYIANFKVNRLSENFDVIPILVSDCLIDINDDWIGKTLKISGQFRSYNQHKNNRNNLILSVFAQEIDKSESYDNNYIFLDGYICKVPIYRKTPLGREIADILLAVNRPYGKSDYIPCIAWGRNARISSSLAVGTRIQINGCIQSRQYNKKLSETEYETRVAYEVSICKMEKIKDEQTKDTRDIN